MAGGILALLASLLPGCLEAQISSSSFGGMLLTTPVEETLVQLQDEWLQWDSAFLQGDRERADVALADMLATTRELGMARLPDLSLGALVRSVAAAKEGDFERARWGIEMADTLDPNRPETAFARSKVAFLDGSYAQAIGHHFVGYLRLFEQQLRRDLWLHNLFLWTLSSLLLTGGLFIAVQMGAKGARLYRGLVASLSHVLPTPLAHLFAILVLAGPLLLPNGWIWVLFLWSALLWGYATASERWLIAVTCVVFGFGPILVTRQQYRLEVALSEPMRAVENLADGRLYGELFRDLGLLRFSLPESRAVDHLIADVHHNINQGEMARPRYLRVAEAEPEIFSVLTNLGAYHYHRKEHIKAKTYLEQASEVNPNNAVGYYNLSQVNRALFAMADADRFLAEARRIDARKVTEWVAESSPVITLNGGFDRRAEIRDELFSVWRGETTPVWQELGGAARSGPLALCVILLALILPLFRRRSGSSGPSRELGASRGFFYRWTRKLLPGLASAERGRGLRAFLSLLIPISCLLLPLSGDLGYRIPWGYDPGSFLAWIVAGLILSLYLLYRLVSRPQEG